MVGLTAVICVVNFKLVVITLSWKFSFFLQNYFKVIIYIFNKNDQILMTRIENII